MQPKQNMHLEQKTHLKQTLQTE